MTKDPNSVSAVPVRRPIPSITAVYLDRAKAVLRGSMAALRGPLEGWERKEFEAVRRSAIAEIRGRIQAVRSLGPDLD